jgi:hypothetical protein
MCFSAGDGRTDDPSQAASRNMTAFVALSMGAAPVGGAMLSQITSATP